MCAEPKEVRLRFGVRLTSGAFEVLRAALHGGGPKRQGFEHPAGHGASPGNEARFWIV